MKHCFFATRCHTDGMYKNQLQELAQRSCFNLPSYSCIREGPDHAPRFKATVNFNGENFESPSFCSTLRQTEHAAAEVALNTLASRGPSRALAARVLDETGVYKNLLQESAHRAGLQLPVYTTVRSGSGHVPVFSCTVELGGMSFTGERARTKKQAQKNSAMAAWFALKRLVQHGSLSSGLSISSMDTKRGGEEQEQVTIARVLASLLPSELKNTKENDCQLRYDRFIPFFEDLTSSTLSLYPMQCQGWVYPGFSPEMAIYQMWQQEQLFHLQNHLLTLQLPPGPPPGPQILPYVQSIVPDSRLLAPTEQECVPMGPRITVTTSMPSLYLSDRVVSDPISGKSRETNQEIHEENHEEPEISMTVVPDTPAVGNFNTEPRSEEPILEDGKQKKGELRSKVESPPAGENQTHQFEWASSRSMDSGIKPADFGAQNPHDYGSCQHPPRPPSPRTNRSTPSMTTPVMIRTVGYVPSSSTAPLPLNRNMGYVPPMQQPSDALAPIPAPPRMRTGCPSYSGRPLPRRMNFGVMNPRFMAPPVRIRSVVPVCSAPPPRKLPTSIQEGHVANSRNNHAVSENATAASSELGKLQL